MKIQNSFGQSLVEYCAIAVLIMVGILAMGPHVVRSVNSYFKAAEDQMQDSFREDIQQAIIHGSENNYELGPDCSCSFPSTYVCGNGSDCLYNEEMRQLQCTPAACVVEYGNNDLDTYICSQERDLSSQNRDVFTDLSVGCFPDCTLLHANCPISRIAEGSPVPHLNSTPIRNSRI